MIKQDKVVDMNKRNGQIE